MAKQRLMNKYGGKTQFDVKIQITKKLMTMAKMCRPKWRRKSVNVYVCLPSEKQICLDEAIKQGLVDKKTHIVAIEQDRWICQKIRIKLGLKKKDRKIKSFTVINKNLLDISYHDMLKAAGRKIDFWYLDTCNTLNREYQKWAETMALFCATKDTIFMSNIMPARVVRDLYSYESSYSAWGSCLEKCLSVGAIEPKNYYWGHIHHCMEEKTGLETCCTINYKEEGVGCPMTVTINSDNHRKRHTAKAWKKLLEKHVDSVQRLGYA